MANKKAKKKTAARAAVAPADKATMVVTLYDGTREPIEDQDFLIRIFDGFQNQLFDDFKPAPTTVFSLPFRDNLQDNCIDRPKSNEISTDISYYGLLRRLIRTDRRPQPCGKHGFIYRTARNAVLEPRRQPLRLGPFG